MEEFPFVKNVPRLFQYRKIGAERLEEKGKHLASKLNSGVVCLEDTKVKTLKNIFIISCSKDFSSYDTKLEIILLPLVSPERITVCSLD